MYFDDNYFGYPSRLNHRYRRIIAPNLDLIRDKRILDIASHDGRWMAAALDAGAAHVVGVEPRENLVAESHHNLSSRVPENRYSLIQRDIHEEIKKFSSNQFDCVFCLGFLDHTPHHIFLLSEIARISRSLILDTGINGSNHQDVTYRLERSDSDITVFSKEEKSWVAIPSESFLKCSLEYYGFESHLIKVDDAKTPLDYAQRKRITLRAVKRLYDRILLD